MVYPDKRKGLLYVYQSEDSLMHFCWQDRTTGMLLVIIKNSCFIAFFLIGVVEDDLIIFPDDCEYVKVPQCTTGRVYLLKFKSSNRRFFFWLQVRDLQFVYLCFYIKIFRNQRLIKMKTTASVSMNI